MRFRRKADRDAVAASGEGNASPSESRSTTPSAAESATGESTAHDLAPRPRDLAEVVGDQVDRVDLGAFLVEPLEGRELRLQVDDASGQVTSVMFAGEEGALEFQAFAAPRHGSLWNEVRAGLVADLTGRGAEVTESDGQWGAELHVRAQVQMPDGAAGVQESRIVGINGPRWMLRASFLGAPARGGEGTQEWEQALSRIVVNRGQHALPVGAPLVVTVPDDARKTR